MVQQVDHAAVGDKREDIHTAANRVVAQPVDQHRGACDIQRKLGNNYKKILHVATSKTNATTTTKKVVFVDLCDSGD